MTVGHQHETLDPIGRGARTCPSLLDRVLGGRVATVVTTFVVWGLIVTALGLATVSAFRAPPREPQHGAVARVRTGEQALWGGPDAVGRRRHTDAAAALWGGPDALGRRLAAR